MTAFTDLAASQLATATDRILHGVVVVVGNYDMMTQRRLITRQRFPPKVTATTTTATTPV